MTKLIKTVLIAGSLITSTAIVSFADNAPKTADKAPSAGSAAGSGSAAASKGKTSTPAKGTGAGKGSGSASK